MKTTLQIIDDFHPFADEVRRCALDQSFGVVNFDGAEYDGWAGYQHPQFIRQMEGLLARSTGKAKIHHQAFVRAPAGHLTSQWIHADNICAKYAAVLYLDKNEQGGTAMWRHLQTRCDRLDATFAERLNLPPAEIVSTMQREGCDESFWELAGYCGARFNRLVWYPSDVFHSRYPREGFGEGDNARLTWVCFFDA